MKGGKADLRKKACAKIAVGELERFPALAGRHGDAIHLAQRAGHEGPARCKQIAVVAALDQQMVGDGPQDLLLGVLGDGAGESGVNILALLEFRESVEPQHVREKGPNARFDAR